MDVGGVVTAIAGDHYQYGGGVGAKHYFANGLHFAERVGGGLTWLLTDHPSLSFRTSLGSTSVTTDQYGAYVTELRYYPYGRPRYDPGGQTTDYRFTGQRWQGDIGLVLPVLLSIRSVRPVSLVAGRRPLPLRQTGAGQRAPRCRWWSPAPWKSRGWSGRPGGSWRRPRTGPGCLPRSLARPA